MDLDINELFCDDVEYDAMESAEILFDYPEVAMESKGADPTRRRIQDMGFLPNTAKLFDSPFLKKPFNPTYVQQMQKYYTSLIKTLIPIAKKVAMSDPEVGRVEPIDTESIIEYLGNTDYNYMATKISDFRVESHKYKTKSKYRPEGAIFRRTVRSKTRSTEVKMDIEPIRIRKLKGDPVLIVTLSQINLQRNFFKTAGYMNKLSKRLTMELNNATNNKYAGEVFLTVHASDDDYSKSDFESSLELNFIIPKKWRV